MSNCCNTSNDFFIFDETRNYVTERIVNKEQNRIIRCLERKYRAGCLPKYSAHYIDKMVPVQTNCPCLSGCTIPDLIRDYNLHKLGYRNSKQFRLTGGN